MIKTKVAFLEAAFIQPIRAT